MLRAITKTELDTRVKAINLTCKWLARAAGLNAMTVLRGPKTVKKQNALVEALEAEELRLLGHLIGLHPQAAVERATVALCPQRKRKEAA